MTNVPSISEFVAPMNVKIEADKTKLIEHCLGILTAEKLKIAMGELVVVDLPYSVPQYDEIIGLVLVDFITAGWVCWSSKNALCFKRPPTAEEIAKPAREERVQSYVKSIREDVTGRAASLAMNGYLHLSFLESERHVIMEAVSRLQLQGWAIRVVERTIVVSVDLSYKPAGNAD